MALGGDAWGLQEDPRVDHWETGPGLQFPPGCILCSIHQLSGICCPLSDPLQPLLPFFLLAATLHLRPPTGTRGDVAAS